VSLIRCFQHIHIFDTFARKITKRLEDLTHDSGALKSHLLPQLKALNNLVPELVNFGISVRIVTDGLTSSLIQLCVQLAQQTMPHLSDVRADKTPFQLATVLSYVKQTAETTVAKNLKPGMSPLDAVGESILELVQEGSNLLPLALESENVAKRQLIISSSTSYAVR
jgi:dynactin 1